MNNRVFKSLALLSFFALLTPLAAQERPDALKLYRDGRALESAGRTQDADAAYNQSVSICRQELTQNGQNMDSYAVLTWSLLRLRRYNDVISAGTDALKVNASDYRIIESMGEAYFYLDNYQSALRMMERYIDAAPRGERIGNAYFFTGEIYRLTGKYKHADIAYSAAVYHEPGIALWWYRLGLARENGGEKTSAETAYRRALQLRENYKEAIDAIARVS